MGTIVVRTTEDSRGTRLSGLLGLTSALFSGGVTSSFAEDVGVDSGGTWTASALVIARLRQGRVQASGHHQLAENSSGRRPNDILLFPSLLGLARITHLVPRRANQPTRPPFSSSPTQVHHLGHISSITTTQVLEPKGDFLVLDPALSLLIGSQASPPVF